MNVKQNMKKINNMMVAVTASWCGACNNISADLDNAIRDPNNTYQGTRLDEKMLDKFNRILKVPIKPPPHFPYFIIINEKGQLKEVLDTLEAVKQFLKGSNPSPIRPPVTNRMNGIYSAVTGDPTNSSAPVNSANNSSANNPSSPVNSANNPSANNPSSPVNSANNPSSIVPSYVPFATVENESDSDSDSDSENEEEEVALSKKFESMSVSPDLTLASSTANQINSVIKSASTQMEPVSGMPNVVAKGPSLLPANSTMSGAVPPSSNYDAVSKMNTGTPLGQKGGCLYSSIANVAYQLAAPAALLGIAAATLRKGRRNRRRSRKI